MIPFGYLLVTSAEYSETSAEYSETSSRILQHPAPGNCRWAADPPTPGPPSLINHVVLQQCTSSVRSYDLVVLGIYSAADYALGSILTTSN